MPADQPMFVLSEYNRPASQLPRQCGSVAVSAESIRAHAAPVSSNRASGIAKEDQRGLAPDSIILMMQI